MAPGWWVEMASKVLEWQQDVSPDCRHFPYDINVDYFIHGMVRLLHNDHSRDIHKLIWTLMGSITVKCHFTDCSICHWFRQLPGLSLQLKQSPLLIGFSFKSAVFCELYCVFKIPWNTSRSYCRLAELLSSFHIDISCGWIKKIYANFMLWWQQWFTILDCILTSGLYQFRIANNDCVCLQLKADNVSVSTYGYTYLSISTAHLHISL